MTAFKTPFANITTGHDEWLTPPELVRSLGEFDLDPCAPINRPWSTAKHHFTVLDDGLSRPWFGRVWCNPPYGTETARWLQRCADHGNAIALVFARTDTKVWQDLVFPSADAILFVRGRIRFCKVDGTPGASTGGAPSALIAWGHECAMALMKIGHIGTYQGAIAPREEANNGNQVCTQKCSHNAYAAIQ